MDCGVFTIYIVFRGWDVVRLDGEAREFDAGTFCGVIGFVNVLEGEWVLSVAWFVGVCRAGTNGLLDFAEQCHQRRCPSPNLY